MWDLPGPGLEPVSPALAGGFLTTVPPGKSPTPAFYLMALAAIEIHCLDALFNLMLKSGDFPP